MIRIRRSIAEHQAKLAEHAFFKRLEGGSDLDETLAFVAAPTFFVMTFQDILRLNESHISDATLLNIARHHRQEDSGHDDWFLHDLAVIEGKQPDIRWLFGPEHACTRDVSFELVSEVFRATDDHARIVLVLILEAGGHIMFRRMADFLEQSRYRTQLRYFSRGHLDVELDHALFETGVDEMLDQIALSEAVHEQCSTLVARGFSALTRLLDGFEQRIVDKSRERSGQLHS